MCQCKITSDVKNVHKCNDIYVMELQTRTEETWMYVRIIVLR